MDELKVSLKDSLLDTGNDLLVDLTEIGVDQFFEDGVLNEIPLVKTLCAVGRIATNVRERNLLKQTLYMINGFRAANISPEQKTKYRDILNQNPKKAEKELERVLLILNETIDSEKSRYIGLIYAAFIQEQISWNMFCEMTEMTRRLFLSDYPVLLRLASGAPFEAGIKPEEIISLNRLIGTGLVLEGHQGPLKTVAEMERRIYSLSNTGRRYLSIIDS